MITDSTLFTMQLNCTKPYNAYITCVCMRACGVCVCVCVCGRACGVCVCVCTFVRMCGSFLFYMQYWLGLGTYNNNYYNLYVFVNAQMHVRPHVHILACNTRRSRTWPVYRNQLSKGTEQPVSSQTVTCYKTRTVWDGSLMMSIIFVCLFSKLCVQTVTKSTSVHLFVISYSNIFYVFSGLVIIFFYLQLSCIWIETNLKWTVSLHTSNVER